jgi:hypothetical protein
MNAGAGNRSSCLPSYIRLAQVGPMPATMGSRHFFLPFSPLSGEKYMREMEEKYYNAYFFFYLAGKMGGKNVWAL